MGQSTSRQQNNTNSAASTPSFTPNIVPHGAPHDTEPVLLPETRRSRRESIRKSILNLVRPSTRPDDQASRSRKSWRNSRRWSKAPRDPSPPAASPQPQETPNAPPSPSPTPTNPKGKEVVQDNSIHSFEGPIASSSRSTPASHSSTTKPEILDNSMPNPIGPDNEPSYVGDAQYSEQHHISHDQDEVVISPDIPPTNTPSTLSGNSQPAPLHEVRPATDSSAPNPHTQPPAHQFPPPGTLVVVQGVVHTTDVPRTSTPTTAPVEAPELIPRPLSTPPTIRNPLAPQLHSHLPGSTGSRPASTIGTLPPSNAPTMLNGTPSFEAPADSTSLHATPLESTPSSMNTDSNQTTTPAAQHSTVNDSIPGTISSGSIDVLGTLLSVAAAATAASLLTGTSEPLLLPPALTPPSYNPSTSSNDSNNLSNPSLSPVMPEVPSSRPTSPTPTAGLGFDTTRAERLRHAWGSIRERLGLRPSPPFNHNTPNLPENDGINFGSSPSGMLPPIHDPREHLFGQMARAFNLGLGLGGDPSSGSGSTPVFPGRNTEGPHPTDIPGSGSRLGQLPGEGSFERFLIDLQRDLRVALTSVNNLSLNETTSDNPETEPAQALAASGNEGSPEVPTVAHQHEERDPSTNTGDESMPPLHDVSDSDSEFDSTVDTFPNAEDDVAVSGAFSLEHGARHQIAQGTSEGASAAVAAASPGLGELPSSVPETDTQGRINWWRLYRFPPIALPPMQGITTSPPSGPDPVDSPSLPPPSSSLVMDPTLSELPFANEPRTSQETNMFSVVPVIVVGVQSVNGPWPPRHPAEEDVNGLMEDSLTPLPDAPADDDASQGRTRGGRGRGWHSRAADAIRNLRSARRTRNPLPSVGPGSRTFLIYVIGGYYPPNHSILNGGPDTLASLEALLELADLLGHAKPPTASKEDIQKSGLEIIKPAQLAQYEKDQKIASNCVERCLICLDDYEPEQNIRLMSCRHGFHQSCVDKWLETGRNNCPACRSKGVSVGGMPEL